MSLRALFITVLGRWAAEHPEEPMEPDLVKAIGGGDLAERLDGLVQEGWSEEFLVLGLVRYGADLWEARTTGWLEDLRRRELLADELEDDEPAEADRLRAEVQRDRERGDGARWRELAAAWRHFSAPVAEQAVRLLGAAAQRRNGEDKAWQ